MYRFSINKELFENILLKKTLILEKENTNYWKKEFLEPKIVDNNISYSLKKIDKIVLSNTLGNDKPQIIAECLGIDYLEDESKFKIYLGKILEQKNINNFKDKKDILISELINEKNELIKILENIKKSIK